MHCINLDLILILLAIYCMWIARIQVHLKWRRSPRQEASFTSSIGHALASVLFIFQLGLQFIARIQVHFKCEERSPRREARFTQCIDNTLHQSWSNSNSGIFWIVFIWMLWLRESCIKIATNHLRFCFRPLASTLLSFTALDSLTKKLDVTVKDLWGSLLHEMNQLYLKSSI